MMRGPKKAVSILMPLELYARVKVQADATDRTIPGYIRQVLKCYLWHAENDPEGLTGEWKIS